MATKSERPSAAEKAFLDEYRALCRKRDGDHQTRYRALCRKHGLMVFSDDGEAVEIGEADATLGEQCPSEFLGVGQRRCAKPAGHDGRHSDDSAVWA